MHEGAKLFNEMCVRGFGGRAGAAEQPFLTLFAARNLHGVAKASRCVGYRQKVQFKKRTTSFFDSSWCMRQRVASLWTSCLQKGRALGQSGSGASFWR